MSEAALQLVSVHRRYVQAGGGLHVLRGASLRLSRGEAVALVGPSGAGKSTLLHVAGLLEAPDGGQVLVDGEDCARMGDARRTLVRRRKLGFVYQFHHLLPEFSALENVVVPQMIAGRSRGDAARRAGDLLDRVGLSARTTHRPGRLSGGEQQRVAIVRAIANDPQVLLADEPTGNLDPGTAGAVFDVLMRLVRGTGLAVLMATHNPDLARRMDRAVRLEDGVLVAA
ncbi:MAG: ABC transporter ATP-binding protein [Rhodospirillales bacterium]|jgi:lipoprotein-releasing system ATP-binding protein